jgi:hypothetical protein
MKSKCVIDALIQDGCPLGVGHLQEVTRSMQLVLRGAKPVNTVKNRRKDNE